MGRNPENQIIASSYNSDLAGDFGRDVRNIVASSEYGNVFPGVSLREDSKAANRWNTNQDGSYVAAGVGGAITGRGAHVALIDDPFKDRKEADSQVIRDNVFNWYTSTFYTRLMPGGAIVLIQTRWHEDDLAGRLLARMESGGDQWHVLIHPALKNGDALWPEWYPVETLERIRGAIGERDFSALYQQQPQPDDGTYYQREWFKWHQKSSIGNKYITTDFAVTDGAGDFTELAVWSVDAKNDVYLVDGWYGQTAADEWIESLLDLNDTHKPLAIFNEAGPIRRAIEPFLTRRMHERKSYARVEWVVSSQEKTARARSSQALASMGKVSLPDNEYGHRALAQMLSFPAGAFDDFVDVFSLMGRVIDEAHPAFVIPAEPKKPRDHWTELEEPQESWRTI